MSSSSSSSSSSMMSAHDRAMAYNERIRSEQRQQHHSSSPLRSQIKHRTATDSSARTISSGRRPSVFDVAMVAHDNTDHIARAEAQDFRKQLEHGKQPAQSQTHQTRRRSIDRDTINRTDHDIASRTTSPAASTASSASSTSSTDESPARLYKQLNEIDHLNNEELNSHRVDAYIQKKQDHDLEQQIVQSEKNRIEERLREMDLDKADDSRLQYERAELMHQSEKQDQHERQQRFQSQLDAVKRQEDARKAFEQAPRRNSTTTLPVISQVAAQQRRFSSPTLRSKGASVPDRSPSFPSMLQPVQPFSRTASNLWQSIPSSPTAPSTSEKSPSRSLFRTAGTSSVNTTNRPSASSIQSHLQLLRRHSAPNAQLFAQQHQQVKQGQSQSSGTPNPTSRALADKSTFLYPSNYMQPASTIGSNSSSSEICAAEDVLNRSRQWRAQHEHTFDSKDISTLASNEKSLDKTDDQSQNAENAEQMDEIAI